MADELKQIKQLDLSTFTGIQNDIYSIDAVSLEGTPAGDYATKQWVYEQNFGSDVEVPNIYTAATGNAKTLALRIYKGTDGYLYIKTSY